MMSGSLIALNHMIKQKSGLIVNVSSIAGTYVSDRQLLVSSYVYTFHSIEHSLLVSV